MAGNRQQAIEAGKKTRFKKGQSGNPAGRPAGVPNTKTRLLRFLELEQEGTNPVTKEREQFTVAELMDLQQIAKALKGDLQAYSALLDRLEGKPPQNHEHSGKDGGPVEVKTWIIEVPAEKPQITYDPDKTSV